MKEVEGRGGEGGGREGGGMGDEQTMTTRAAIQPQVSAKPKRQKR